MGRCCNTGRGKKKRHFANNQKLDAGKKNHCGPSQSVLWNRIKSDCHLPPFPKGKKPKQNQQKTPNKNSSLVSDVLHLLCINISENLSELNNITA